MPVPLARRVLLAMCVSLVLQASQNALSGVISPRDVQGPPVLPMLDFEEPADSASTFEGLENPSGTAAVMAIRHGRWSQACNIATRILARKVPNVEALGIFALCEAIRNDREAANRALERLLQTEAKPGYYGLLTEGVLHLREGLPEKAESTFREVLRSRSGDPLALFFSGEALHARHKDAEAILSFKAVLKTWPDHAPALTAIARLLATPKASRDKLKEALALTERATSIDPSNLAHWRLLAELCRRTGQHDRANAIAIQWLQGPPRVR